MMSWTIEDFGEQALLLHRAGKADAEDSAQLHAIAAALRTLPGVVDVVPAWTSILLRFDPYQWQDAVRLRRMIEQKLATTPEALAPAEAREITLPVCYGGIFGPDIDAVAQHAQLAAAEVIKRHMQGQYRVAMVGFAPGFPYLAGLDATLATPRRAEPRLEVPPGSVAIGGTQTGIYPRKLPGGWQLIGRTPRRIFDVNHNPAALLRPGDRLRFVSIDEAAFRRLTGTE